jgi:nucleolar complex protein 2
MPKKGAKATKKFAKSGELKRTIDARRKHQKVKRQIQARKSVRGAPVSRGHRRAEDEGEPGDESREGQRVRGKGKARPKTVSFMDEDAESDAPNTTVASKGR